MFEQLVPQTIHHLIPDRIFYFSLVWFGLTAICAFALLYAWNTMHARWETRKFYQEKNLSDRK
jgi:hypothetical protein